MLLLLLWRSLRRGLLLGVGRSRRRLLRFLSLRRWIARRLCRIACVFALRGRPRLAFAGWLRCGFRRLLRIRLTALLLLLLLLLWDLLLLRRVTRALSLFRGLCRGTILSPILRRWLLLWCGRPRRWLRRFLLL